MIPRREIRIRTARSGGPGGQNVNKVETKVEVIWNLDASHAFTPERKRRLREALGDRLAADGTLRVSSQRHRTQTRNREAAIERLQAIVEAALRPRKKRRKTAPHAAAIEERLGSKRRRSGVKRLRRSTAADHEE